MKLKQLLKLFLVVYIIIFFTSCNDSRKESGYKASLPMPGSGKTRELGLIGVWHDAKKDPIPATKIGYAYSEELKDYDKALEWYKYSDSMKSSADNSNYACYALQKLKNYDEAISWCNKAIELGSIEALYRLGKVYELNNQYDEAIKFYKESYDKSKDLIALSNIGASYYKLKDYTKAEKYYKDVIKVGTSETYETYQNIASFYHNGLKDDIKASAYSIAVINTKYSKSSVLKLLRQEWRISYETIKKGYELQLNSPDFPIKYKGKL